MKIIMLGHGKENPLTLHILCFTQVNSRTKKSTFWLNSNLLFALSEWYTLFYCIPMKNKSCFLVNCRKKRKCFENCWNYFSPLAVLVSREMILFFFFQYCGKWQRRALTTWANTPCVIKQSICHDCGGLFNWFVIDWRKERERENIQLPNCTWTS